MFKTWTDRQIASRRHVFLRASLTISGSTSPQPLEHSWQSTGPKKKKKKIPARSPFRINQFLNGERDGIFIFFFFGPVDCHECSPSQ